MAIIDKRGTDGFPASIDDIPAAALTQATMKCIFIQVLTLLTQV